jgi:hypothetical protein
MLESLTTAQLTQLLTLCKARLRCQSEPPNTLPRPIVREVWQMATQALVNLAHRIGRYIHDRKCANA